MAKQGASTAVPRLRFPEFRKAADWEEVALSDVSEMRAGKFVAASDIADAPANGWFPCYGGNGLRGYTRSFTHAGKYSLIGRQGALCGNVRLFDGKFHATEHALVVTPKDGIDTGWLFFALGLLELNKYSIGQAQPGLSVQVLEKISIAIPCHKAEQQKIADCLTSLDEVIAAQRRKVEALKTHKRGLMQQLFPRIGESSPRLRFTEFASKTTWHLQKISNLLSKAAHSVCVDPESTYREIGIRSHGKGIFHKEPVRGRVIGAKRVFRVVQDALVLNIVFAWEQAVATTSNNDVGMIASHRFPMYVAKPDKCDVGYVKDFFLTQVGKLLLGVASPGGAGRNKTLGQKEFENLEIPLPVSVGEQQRIADCLSSLDTQIAAESSQLAALKTHKQGLMQQLFSVAADAGA